MLIHSPLTIAPEFARTLADSQIAIYPISVFGVETDALGAESRGLGDPTGMSHLDASFARRQSLHEDMQAVADLTGGRPIFGTNDLSGALGQILSEGADTYTLAYRPTNNDFHKQLRQIRVSVKRSHVSLSYRHAYIAAPFSADATRTQGEPGMELRAALEPGTPLFTALPLSSELQPPAAGAHVVRLSSVLDVRAVPFTLDSAGRRHARLLVQMAAFPAKTDRKQPPPQTAALLTLDLDAAQYAKMLADGMRIERQLELEPGVWSVRLGVEDLGSGRTGTVELPAEVQ